MLWSGPALLMPAIFRDLRELLRWLAIVLTKADESVTSMRYSTGPSLLLSIRSERFAASVILCVIYNVLFAWVAYDFFTMQYSPHWRYYDEKWRMALKNVRYFSLYSISASFSSFFSYSQVHVTKSFLPHTHILLSLPLYFFFLNILLLFPFHFQFLYTFPHYFHLSFWHFHHNSEANIHSSLLRSLYIFFFTTVIMVKGIISTSIIFSLILFLLISLEQ